MKDASDCRCTDLGQDMLANVAEFDKRVLGDETERGRLKVISQCFCAHLDCNACLFRVLGAQAENLGLQTRHELTYASNKGIGGDFGRSLLGKARVCLSNELDTLQIVHTLLPISCLVVCERLSYATYLAI